MRYEDLHQHYGLSIAKRVQKALTKAEFTRVSFKGLLSYLKKRAEIAHKEYHMRLDNPFINEELGTERKIYLDLLHSRWRMAEDLFYTVMVAEDVSRQPLKLAGNQ